MRIERKVGNVVLVAHTEGADESVSVIVDASVIGSDASRELGFGAQQLVEAALDLAERDPWVVEHSGL